MPERLEFALLHHYNMFVEGITVPIILKYGDLVTTFDAKVDTGSTYCVFERGNGEGLGIEIESGIPIQMGTATGDFRAFGHELTLTVLGIETVSTVYFAESDYFDRNVLGRIGWLNKVKLGLIEEENKLYLSEYK
jgi:predicted aspartyl protease